MLNDGQRSQIHFSTEYAFIMDYQSNVLQSRANEILLGRSDTRCMAMLYYVVTFHSWLYNLSTTKWPEKVPITLVHNHLTLRNTNIIPSRAFQEKNNPIFVESLMEFNFAAYYSFGFYAVLPVTTKQTKQTVEKRMFCWIVKNQNQSNWRHQLKRTKKLWKWPIPFTLRVVLLQIVHNWPHSSETNKLLSRTLQK